MAKRIFGIGISLVAFTICCIGILHIHKTASPFVVLVEKPTIDERTAISSNRLIIPKIGVNAPITTNEAGLSSGGWVQLLDIETELPEVIAIHRYGESHLNTEEQRRQTLINVHQLQPGDEVIITWEGEQYHYEISRMSQDSNNPDIGKDDLLIYTCLFFNNSKRIFITAEPTD
jgi:sortase (surface protein transpeptidase)